MAGLIVSGLAFAETPAPVSVGALAEMRDPPARHAPKKVLGRDYWTLFFSFKFSDPNVPLEGEWNNPAIAALPMFQECGIVHWSGNLSLPEGKATWRTVAGNFFNETSSSWRNFEANDKLGRPLTLMFHPKCRYAPAMAGEIDLDYEDYAVWKSRRRHLTAIRVQSEWGVDLVQLMLHRNDPKFSAELRAELNRVYDAYKWTDRYDWVQRAYWYMNRRLALHYNDTEFFESFRSANFLDHIAAAAGAKTLVSETTNTSDWNAEYRWDVSTMFIRGAARQFGIVWRWYVAGFFNGPTSDGGWLNNSHATFEHPERGISASSERRACYYAYLNGAGAVEPESWSSNFFTRDDEQGLIVLSERGQNFSAFHNFTHARPERGVTYAPVAVLVPLAQGYNTCGGRPWGFCDYGMADQMIDGVFFTICPAFDRRKLMKHGKEGNLHNSPYAMMYDVLVPDTTQPGAEFLAALNTYPAAILTGKYPAKTDLLTPLKRYVEDGGTLVLNAAYLERGFSSDFTGVATNGQSFVCSGTFEDHCGKSFPVKGAYDALELEPSYGTAVIVKDPANSKPLITLAEYGKGKVVVVAPLWMSPRFDHDANYTIHKIRSGERSFAFTEYLLTRLQQDLFPFRVYGGCQYGANRTQKGWWLWAFNNKGVTKYTDTAQVVDPARAAKIRIRLGDVRASKVTELVSSGDVPVVDGGFAWSIPPGDVAVFEITFCDHPVVTKTRLKPCATQPRNRP